MGFLLLLNFALLCIDYLAWPVIALGYPMFASIRAIETGSIYHMRKLVIYWTLFSIISLFEYALVKIIDWLPFWSSIKLVAIFWFVIPRFHGACHAYRSFVHPHLVVNLQEFINSLYKPNDEQPRTKEKLLDVSEKYIKENGSEALEKLIASKTELKDPVNSQRGIQLVEPDENNVTTASKQTKEPNAVQKDKEMVEAPEKTASTESKELKEPDAVQKDKEMLEALNKIASTNAIQSQMYHPRPTPAACCVFKETTYTAAKTRDITSPETCSENKQPPPKKVEREWTCSLCQVTTTCERNLSDHLQGKKHKSMCESLKTSKLNAQDTRPSSSTSKDRFQQESCEGKTQEKREIQVVEPDKNINFTTAPKQLKEPDAVRKDKEMLEALNKIALTDAIQPQVHHPRPTPTSCLVIKETTYTDAKTKEITSLETSPENRQPPSKKVDREWTCPSCQVTTSCEKNLSDHLEGKKHKSMCESLKTSKLNAQECRPSSTSKDGSQQESCEGKKQEKRGIQVAEPDENNITTTPKFKKIQEMLEAPDKIASTEAKQGKKHKYECESLKTSKLNAQDMRPPSSTSKDGSLQESCEGKTPREKIQNLGSSSDMRKHQGSTEDAAASERVKLWCNLCSLKLLSEIDVESHLKGKRHSSNIRKMVGFGGVKDPISLHRYAC
ncbi:hypothetical protein OROGR_009709 [Orobanche gracilis]